MASAAFIYFAVSNTLVTNGNYKFSNCTKKLLKRKKNPPKPFDFEGFYGGDNRTRTCDLMRVKQIQISFYIKKVLFCMHFAVLCHFFIYKYHAISRCIKSVVNKLVTSLAVHKDILVAFYLCHHIDLPLMLPFVNSHHCRRRFTVRLPVFLYHINDLFV